MNFSFLSAWVLPAAIVMAAPTLTACGNIEEEREPAQYPQGGVGINTAEELSAHPQRSASLEAIPPGAAAPQRIDEANGGLSGEGDIAIGVDANSYADTDPSALTDFRSTLDPYGAWQDDPNYGTVWTPSSTVVGHDFSPYVTAGHWTYDTDYVWVSDYDWGWAPFHYGRWVYITGRGWSWIPGRQYSGAWVSWRTGYDGYGYVGWAPYQPTWYWRGGYAYGIYGVSPAPYVFCGTGDLFRPGVGGYIVQGPQVAAVAVGTRPFVPATPTVNAGGRQLAHPAVASSGPPPGRLGIQAASIPAPPHQQDRGLMRAQQFSQPATAQAAGGRPPTAAMSSRPERIPSSAPIANGTRSLGSTSTPSSFGATAHAPSYVPSRNGASAPYARPMPLPSQQRPTQLPSHYSSPSYGSSPSYSSHPSFGSSPSSGFGGSHSAAPSYSPSPSFRSSSPSFSSSSPSFHSSPSSAPSFHSAPSSHPSFSAPSHGGGGGGFSRGRR